MTLPLATALAAVRERLVDGESLVRAVASGRRRANQPPWRRVELRYVDLKAGRRLQVTAYDATQAHTSNHAVGADAERAVDDLLALPFGNWHVETASEAASETVQLRVTKRGDAMVSKSGAAPRAEAAPTPPRAHDRAKERLIREDDPLLRALEISDAAGRVKPSRRDKFRQVEEFCRQLDATLADAWGRGLLRRPTAAEPLRVVDLGAGNAYLTFAAHRLLTMREVPVSFVGVDVKAQSRTRNERIARELGVEADFVTATIGDYRPEVAPEVVLALHACDTATDDALARAVEWQAAVVLAAPCCHHDIAAQLRAQTAPAPYGLLTRHGIVRERFADTLTDALRAALLVRSGYQVDVVEFIGSQHTPRNTLLRGVRTGKPVMDRDYDELVAGWGVRPRLGELLAAVSGGGGV